MSGAGYVGYHHQNILFQGMVLHKRKMVFRHFLFHHRSDLPGSVFLWVHYYRISENDFLVFRAAYQQIKGGGGYGM